MYKKLTLLILFLFLLVPFVSAVPPFQEAGGTDILEIRIPQAEFLKVNTDIQSNLHIHNKTTGLEVPNTLVDCSIHIYNATGHHQFEGDYINRENVDKQLNISGGNFLVIGKYSFEIGCNATPITNIIGQGGFVGGSFLVTESGTNESTIPIALIYLGILGLLIVFLGISIYGIVKSEHIVGKYIFVVLTYISFTTLTFISFLIATTFILSSPFIVWFIRFLFLLSLWIFLPFFFISLSFLLWKIYQIKAIKNLIEKGVPEDEAYKRVKK